MIHDALFEIAHVLGKMPYLELCKLNHLQEPVFWY